MTFCKGPLRHPLDPPQDLPTLRTQARVANGKTLANSIKCRWGEEGGSALRQTSAHVHMIDRARILPLVPGRGAAPRTDPAHLHMVKCARILPRVPGEELRPPQTPRVHGRTRTHFTCRIAISENKARWLICTQHIWIYIYIY